MDISLFLSDLRAEWALRRVPNISEKTGRFLSDLICVSKSSDILEIGGANGYSTIWLTDAARKNGGHVTSVDYSRPTYEEAVENIREVGFLDDCTLIFANALDVLPGFAPDSFDFIFIDAQKKRTVDFFRLAYPLVRPGGCIVVDDVIKFRFKMESFYEYIGEQGIAHSVLQIDEDDGVMMIVKPKD